MKDTKYGNAIFEPHVFSVSVVSACGTGWHSLPSMHDSIIDGQASPVAHLFKKLMNKN